MLFGWDCWEPYQRIAFSPRDAMGHVLILGSTGSGKTTLLISALQQLIAYRADNPKERIGLLVLDGKCDGTADLVRAMARHVGRESDLVLVGVRGDHFIDPFGSPEERGLRQIDNTVTRLLLGTERLTGNNGYWEEARRAMLDAALTLMLVAGRNLDFDPTVSFLRNWFFGPRIAEAEVNMVVHTAKSSADRRGTPGVRRKVQMAVDQAAVWRELDPRTRSNLQSVLINVLRPLLSVSAADYFETRGRPRFDPVAVADGGKICVVTGNTLIDPYASRLLLRMARWDFFNAVQRRGAGNHPICGLLADELALVVAPEDCETLATVRSRSCFVLSCTQGLIGIEAVVGPRLRRLLTQHFNSTIWLRSREEETQEMAAAALGLRLQPVVRGRGPRWKPGQPEKVWYDMVPICPPAALGRLEPHQGFAIMIDGSYTEHPISFVPWFENPRLAFLREPLPDRPVQPNRTAQPSRGAAHMERLMTDRGFRLHLTADEVGAIARHSSAGQRRTEILAATTILQVGVLSCPPRIPTADLLACGPSRALAHPGETQLGANPVYGESALYGERVSGSRIRSRVVANNLKSHPMGQHKNRVQPRDLSEPVEAGETLPSNGSRPSSARLSQRPRWCCVVNRLSEARRPYAKEHRTRVRSRCPPASPQVERTACRQLLRLPNQTSVTTPTA
jgi:hypothetical protein